MGSLLQSFLSLRGFSASLLFSSDRSSAGGGGTLIEGSGVRRLSKCVCVPDRVKSSMYKQQTAKKKARFISYIIHVDSPQLDFTNLELLGGAISSSLS